MGLLDRLLNKQTSPTRQQVSPPAAIPETRKRPEAVDVRDESTLPSNAILLGGQRRLDVQGEIHYQDALDRVCGGKTEEGHLRRVLAILEPEPENPYDKNAIALKIDGEHVGYVDRKSAEEYAPLAKLLSDKGKVGAARAFISGGWRNAESEGHYGIELELSSVEDLMKTRKVTNLLKD